MSLVREKVHLPLAAGERYHSKWEFRELFRNNYVNYIRPDVGHCGDFTEMRKITAMAGTNNISVIPHNNAGPLGTAASLHTSLASAKVVLMEAPFVNRDVTETNIFGPFPIVEDGYALPLEQPGLGIEFNENAASDTPLKLRTMPKLDAPDGSVRDG